MSKVLFSRSSWVLVFVILAFAFPWERLRPFYYVRKSGMTRIGGLPPIWRSRQSRKPHFGPERRHGLRRRRSIPTTFK